MTLTQYLLQLPEPVFGQDTVNEAAEAGELPELPEKVIKAVEARLQLPFVPMMASNLCYIQNDEVLPEFRTSFHDLHLLDALYACNLNLDSSMPSLDLLSFPSDTDLFWKLSEYGKDLRILHTLNFKLTHTEFDFVDSPESEKKVTELTSDFPFFQQGTREGSGNIWIDARHYFTDVSKNVWDLRIYQRYPAREALKILQETPLPPSKVLEYQHRLYALKQSLPLQKAIRVLGLGMPLL